MTLQMQDFGKTFVAWKVHIPERGSKTRSDDFNLDGLPYELVFEVTQDESPDDEKLTMYFKKRSASEMPANCVLQSYVKDKGNRHLFMVRTEITWLETAIWSYTRRSFFYEYPNAEFADNSLTFGFLFSNFRIPKLKNILLIETEHKSVQTSPYLDDRYCLRSLSLDLHKLMDEGSEPDVQLRCGDCTVPAHKLILGARSEVFHTMLQTDMVEGREGSVEIVDMEPKVFQIFVRYLYTGILPELAEDTASPLYEAGDKYRLEAMRGRCGDFLAGNLNPENACEILVMADAHSDKDLKERVVFYILQEKIPDNDEEWTKFCDGHPKLAIEVFRRSYKQSLCS